MPSQSSHYLRVVHGIEHAKLTMATKIKVADLAGLKDELARKWFCWLLQDVVWEAWDSSVLADGAALTLTNSKKLQKALSAVRNVRQALADLDEQTRESLWWPIDEIEGGAKRLLEWVIGKVEPVRRRSSEKSKRPPGKALSAPFDIFARDLMQLAFMAGGDFTWNKTTGRGPLIEAFELLSPFLPPKLIPRVPRLSTLQRIKADLKRRIAAHRPGPIHSD